MSSSRDEHRPLSARVLSALAASGEALTLLQLAPLAEAPTNADCSEAIKRMEMRGYVERTPDSQRRSISWRITDAGRERLARGGFRAPRGEFSHGARAGYTVYGCRCKRCRAWAHDNYQEQREAHPPAPDSEAAHSRAWRAENPEKAATKRARDHAEQQRKNTELRDVADRHGQEWTGTELELASRADLTAEEVAKMIGRTIRSVTSMREELRSSDPRNRMLRDGTPPTSRSRPRRRRERGPEQPALGGRLPRGVPSPPFSQRGLLEQQRPPDLHRLREPGEAFHVVPHGLPFDAEDLRGPVGGHVPVYHSDYDNRW